ncbi:MAG TPA: hypothetical protein ENJ95_08805 [Bacteroidetes bacterium]|nr:hypothetical protein [Bacteroidota bacterium]
MTELKLEKPLTNLQMEMLKLFSANLTDANLNEVSEWLSKYFMKKSSERATEIWDKKGYSEKDVKKWLNPKQKHSKSKDSQNP